MTALCVALCAVTGPVMAQTQDNMIPLSALDAIAQLPDPSGQFSRVVFALDQEGYIITSVRETMLNRALIRARNAAHEREIVVSRASGRILRDVVVEEFRSAPPVTMVPIDSILEEFDGGIRVLRR